MKKNNPPLILHSISELHRTLGLPGPQHPLVSLVWHRDVQHIDTETRGRVVFNFYNVSMKKSFRGVMKYGKHYYDFDEGTMSFVSPGQVIAVENDGQRDCTGWSLFFHPDLIRNHPLGKQIKQYGFFSYAVNEALHLSDKEEGMIESLIKNIEQEYHGAIDTFSQDVMVSYVELLLHYANRFYHRQFITRKTAAAGDVLTRVEALLQQYFAGDGEQRHGLPSVQYLAESMHVSASYLSDMLKTLTGQGAQQHIHHMLIEKAKEALATTALSVSEIAYQLGFEHPQSFNKLFKNKTSVSPLAFRGAFN